MHQRPTSGPKALGYLGRYTLFEEMAEGGMARVFLAQREGARQLCVLKQLHAQLESHDTAGIRFQREAHLVSQLTHTNIARVLDAGIEEGKFCIAMELIEGLTLQEILDVMRRRSMRVPIPITMAVGMKVLEGLSYAHALRGADGRHLGIVHRDLSPKNVMVGYDGSVKIIDFGVAQGRIDNFRTAPGMIVGTLHYMSPEQAETGPVDARSDLYTLSVVLWEMLAGRPAVRDGKAIDVLEQVIGESPPPLMRIDPGLPAAVSDVVARGLSKDPETRWQSASRYRDALVEAAKSVGGTTVQKIGALVEEVLPRARHPVTKWVEHLGADRVLAEVPTLADDSLKASDVVGTTTPPPLSSASQSTTMPDADPPKGDRTPSADITVADEPTPQQIQVDEILRLERLNQALEKRVRRQQRMMILLVVALLGSAALTAAAFFTRLS